MVDPHVPEPGMISLSVPLIAIQMCNFLVTLVALNYLLIKPIREIIAKRNAKVAGLIGETENFTVAAEEKLVNYDAELIKARSEAAAKREIIKAEAADREHEILSRAGADAQAFIQESKARVASEVESAMKVLRAQVDALSAKAVNRILG